MATVNDRLRAQRTKLGLTEAEVARRAGLSLDEYRDAEQHEDEAFQVLHLPNVRSLCAALDLDPLDVFGVPCMFCDGTDTGLAGGGGGRHELVRARRLALGLSEADLAERIGFEAGVVSEMEKAPDYLDAWSVELVLSLAQVLGLPPQVLMNVRCRKCGR